MDTKTFETLLDRWGTDLAAWPAAEADDARRLLVWSRDARQSYDALLKVESWIDATRPLVVPGLAQRIIHRALADIQEREANLSLLERFRRLLTAPLPRAAFAMSVTAIGFAIGFAVHSPITTHYDMGGGLTTASADDVLF